MRTEAPMFTQTHHSSNQSTAERFPTFRRATAGVILSIVALSITGMSGCNNGLSGGFVGAGLGAGAGAIIGSAFGHAGTGALIGTGAGLLSGAFIGDQNERNARYRQEDYHRYEAQQREEEYQRNNP